MKQIIDRYLNGNISQKTYINNIGQYHGLAIRYWENGNRWWKANYVNGKEYGLYTLWGDKCKINKRIYHL